MQLSVFITFQIVALTVHCKSCTTCFGNTLLTHDRGTRAALNLSQRQYRGDTEQRRQFERDTEGASRLSG